jgi:hypothetical protein
MAILASRICLGFTYVLFATMLSVPVGLSQVKGSDSTEFNEVVIQTGGDPDAVEVADVNHDGSIDIIAANPEHGTVSFLLGDRRL